MERAQNPYAIDAGDPRRDEDEIVRLCSIELPGFTRPHYWKYFFENPLGPPALVVARHADDGLVGVAALHPTSFMVNGIARPAAVAGNFAVDRRHRAFGPALALQRRLLELARERGWTFLLGLPNEQSEGVFTRVGYSEVGKFTRSVRLLSVRETLASVKARSGAGTREFVHALARGRVTRAVRGWSVSTPLAFGPELEPAWAAATTQASIVPLRTPELLEWKYERLTPESGFSLTTVSRDGEVGAFSVSRVSSNVRHVVDVCWHDRSAATAILAAEIERSARERLSAVDVLHLGEDGELEAALDSLGFFPVAAPALRVRTVTEPTPPGEWLAFEGVIDV